MRLINILLVLLLVLLYVYKLGLVRSNEFEVETKEQIHTNLQISSNTMGGGLNLYSEEKEGMLLYYLVYIPEENACEYCEITCQNGKTESKKIVKYSSVEYRVVVDENREYM